jgi:hypothetical protein
LATILALFWWAAAPLHAAELELPPFRPQQQPLPVAPPADAIVLFDGGTTNRFLAKGGGPLDWPVVDGALVSTNQPRLSNHIVSQYHFRDAELHVEFQLPPSGAGNSGVYLHGNYELQIYNSHGRTDLSEHDMGAIYGFAPPLAQAAQPPGAWQVYDIRYRAPRRDAEEQIVEPGRISAWLNGVEVQREFEVGEPRSTYHPFRFRTTPYLQAIAAKQRSSSIGPVFLQDHDHPVRFRNVWIRPLDDCGYWYEPAAE